MRGGSFEYLYPQYLGDEKMHTETTVEIFPTPLSQKTPQALPNEVVTVFRGGQAIYKTSTPVPAAVSGYIGFWTYGSHWALEVIDQITIDGQPVNHQFGYDKSFEFHLLNQKPLFFFEKGGKLGLNMDGKEIPLPWPSIPHYGCCSASALNPVQMSNLLFFFWPAGRALGLCGGRSSAVIWTK